MSADGTSLRYDGFANFIQGDFWFTYMLVEGVGYVVESSGDNTTSAATTSVRCLSSITPFDAIVGALNNLTDISSGSVSDDSQVDCSHGTLYGTLFGGKEFVVCGSGAADFIAYGGDIVMAVEYLNNPLHNISAPTLNDSEISCAEVANATSVTPTTLALLTGDATSSTCPSINGCY